jgi:hypothetical protein
MIEAERKNAIFSNLNEFEESEMTCLYTGMYIYEYTYIYICINTYCIQNCIHFYIQVDHQYPQFQAQSVARRKI